MNCFLHFPPGSLGPEALPHHYRSYAEDNPVHFDRVPAVGELIQGPDGMRLLRIAGVTWWFDRGFAIGAQVHLYLETA